MGKLMVRTSVRLRCGPVLPSPTDSAAPMLCPACLKLRTRQRGCLRQQQPSGNVQQAEALRQPLVADDNGASRPTRLQYVYTYIERQHETTGDDAAWKKPSMQAKLHTRGRCATG